MKSFRFVQASSRRLSSQAKFQASSLNRSSPTSSSAAPSLQGCRYFFSSFPRSDGKPRPDPFARRPNQKCDPYGQGGKPLTAADAERLLATVHPDWALAGEAYSSRDDSASVDAIPTHLTRSFMHPDFISGSSFLTHVAAVAQMNDHFPSLRLERKLDSKRKQWSVVSTVTCNTFVLEGLSHHDFFVATLIDVEMERPEVHSLILRESDTQ